MKFMYNGYFMAPDLQVHEAVHANRHYDLGLDASHFSRLEAPPPWPDKPLTVVELVMRLPDGFGKSGFERTIEEYWRRLIWPGIAAGGRSSRMPDLRFDREHLIDLNRREYVPGLSWAVLDLGASWWPQTACSPHQGSLLSLSEGQFELAGIEILAAAAMHPDWLKAMDGTKVPFVWLPGLLLKIDGLDHKTHPYTPALSYRKDGFVTNFTAGSSRSSHPYFAVPRLLSTST